MVSANMPSYPKAGCFDAAKLCACAIARENSGGSRNAAEAQTKMGLMVDPEILCAFWQGLVLRIQGIELAPGDGPGDVKC